MYKITLIDDHQIVRTGLKELIQKLGPYEVNREFANGAELFNVHDIHENCDLILLDLDMPLMNGEETLEELNQRGIAIPVLMLTLSEDEKRIIRMFKMGANGYLHKNCSAATLRAALEDVLTNGYYHSEMLTKAMRTPSDKVKDAPRELWNALSPREQEFIKWVCDEQEYTYEAIAHEMGVSRRTVDGYRESVFQRLGVKSKTGMVLFLLKNNLMEV